MKKENNFWELSTGKIFNELNSEEEKEFKALLEEGDNKKLFQKVKKVHNGLRTTQSLKDVSSLRSWEIISNKIRLQQIKIVKSVLKYAAIVIFAFAAGALLKTNYTNKSQSPVYAEFKVPLGQMSEITLYDGTHVWLNSGTTLKYEKNFGEESRNVILDGEAFFKVKHSEIPFKVKLKKTEVEVLGTSFNVISYKEENQSQVTLIHGSVKINNHDGEEMTRLKPTEQITIPDNLKGINIRKVNTDFYSSWTEGKIEFEEERLEDIAFRLERWYNVEIKFNSKEAKDLRFSGTVLKNKPFDQIVKAFELLLPLNIEYRHRLDKKDVVVISKKNMPMKK